jgi:hypothetical protein
MFWIILSIVMVSSISNGWKLDSINKSFAIEYIIRPSVVAQAN